MCGRYEGLCSSRRLVEKVGLEAELQALDPALESLQALLQRSDRGKGVAYRLRQPGDGGPRESRLASDPFQGIAALLADVVLDQQQTGCVDGFG